MKKLLSIVLSAVMLCTCFSAIPVQAKVRYDKDNTAVNNSNYTMLNISGTEYNKGAFDVLNRLNSYRNGNGISYFKMDKELMEGAMLRAREFSVYLNRDYRANGEECYKVFDGSGMSNNYMYIFSDFKGTYNPQEVADDFYNIDSDPSIITNPDFVSVGIGCFRGADGVYFWAMFVTKEEALNPVTVNDYSATTSNSVKIAVRNEYKSAYWNKVHTHANSETIVKADAAKKTNGKVTRKCSVCGAVSQSTIYYPKTITLSQTTFTYDGKVKKPNVTVKDANGKTVGSQYYTVSYASGRKNVGKYAVKITFKGNYTGVVTKYITINPPKTAISSITPASKAFTVKWTKKTTQTQGYQIQYATNSKFTSAKSVTVAKNTTVSKKIAKLQGKKKYYVRVRTYKKVGSATYYSSWSPVKNVTTKGTSSSTTKTTTTSSTKTSSVVYVTPTGKCYHNSKSCAGSNAIQKNLSQVKSSYKPCSKCV